METFKAVLFFLILCAVLFVEDSFQKKSCKVVPLKARTFIKAKIIFSGTVISIINDGKYSSERHIFGRKKHQPGKNIFAAKIVIKRTAKFRELLVTYFQECQDGHSHATIDNNCDNSNDASSCKE